MFFFLQILNLVHNFACSTDDLTARLLCNFFCRRGQQS